MDDASLLLTLAKDLGPMGVVLIFTIYMVVRDGRAKKNGHGVDIGKVVGVQEEQGDLLEKIEEHGTVPFQNYKADMNGWKRERKGFEDRHGPRVDNAHRRIDALKERVGNLTTTHNLIHPDQKVD